MMFLFFFNESATTEIYTYVHPLSPHDALPSSRRPDRCRGTPRAAALSFPNDNQAPRVIRQTRHPTPCGASAALGGSPAPEARFSPSLPIPFLAGKAEPVAVATGFQPQRKGRHHGTDQGNGKSQRLKYRH